MSEERKLTLPIFHTGQTTVTRSIQEATEEVMFRLTRTMHSKTGSDNLCLAGKVSLNYVGNGKVLRDAPSRV